MPYSTVCQLCGSSKSSVIVPSAKPGKVVRCKECGFTYVSSRNEEQMIDEVAGRVIRPEIPEDRIKEAEYRKANFLIRLKQLEKYIGDRKGKLLDVGCSEGTFLYEAEKMGWEVFGIEPEYGTSNYAVEKYKLNVLTATLQEAGFEDDYFDVVTFYHSLEHIPDPKAALLEAKRILKPGGLLVIEVPNIECMSYKILRSRWRSFMVYSHYFFFSPETLKRILTQADFEVLGCMKAGKIISLRYFLGRLVRFKYFGRFSKVLFDTVNLLKLGDISIFLNLGDIIITYSRKPKSA